METSRTFAPIPTRFSDTHALIEACRLAFPEGSYGTEKRQTNPIAPVRWAPQITKRTQSCHNGGLADAAFAQL